MTNIFRRVKAVLSRHRLEQDLQDELNSHLKMDAQERLERGDTPQEAHMNARHALGSTLRTAENVREAWGTAGIDRLMQDLRYAFRQMKRSPPFTLAAILTLGLGIGANTAIFSVVNAILLRPLPYKHSERLVRIVENIPAAESFSGAAERTTDMSPDSFQDWRSKTTTLSGMAMERQISKTLVARDAVRLSGLQVSPALFGMFEVQPALGRVFAPDEEKPGLDRVVILSFGTWQRVFGGDPQILGKTVALDNAPYTVVGIMPREFAYPDSQTEFWLPLSLPVPGLLGLPVVARLKDGVSLTTAAEEAAAIGRYMRGESSADPQPSGPPRIQLMTLKEELVGRIRPALVVFVIAVSFVLLIACVNVANLFLARAAARNREIAIRMALGAGRWRVLRQLLTESCVLALAGGIAGVGLAIAGTRFFVALGQGLARTDLVRFDLIGNAIPRLNEVAIDASTLLFTLLLTVITGILFGLIPAFQIGRATSITRMDLQFGTTAVPMRVVRTAMLVGQISLTMVLLIGAGLLIKSFMTLANTSLGYDPSNVLTFKIPQPALDYPQGEKAQKQQNAFAEEVARRLQLLPGTQAAAFTNNLPMVQGCFTWGGFGLGDATCKTGRMAVVSRDYFRAMGMRLIAGRGFAEQDRGNPQAVFLLNRAAVKAHFQGVNPVGKTVADSQGFLHGEIVGVVDDTRQAGPDTEPMPQLFMDPEHFQAVYGEGYYFVVRTTKDPAAILPSIRSIVHDLDPKAVVDNVATMDQVISNSITTPRSYAALLGTFAAAALALATIGLYGLLSFFVKERTQEIGIRVAIGAQTADVIGLVLKHGLGMSIAGLAIGLAGSAILMQYLQTMLFGVAALDPVTFTAVSGLFLLVAFLASYLPARAAATIDPLKALRYE
ncbi:MAG TPA: ABC transporter permease [Terriglobia bacterium]|jgi:putative ABC transport system permease protein